MIIQKYRSETLYLGIVWIGLSFAGFGIQTSVPNQIRHLRYLSYQSRGQKIIRDFYYNYNNKVKC